MRPAPSIVPQGGAPISFWTTSDILAAAGARLTPTAPTALIRDLVEGHYKNPVRVVAFNTAEGWSRDVTADIAEELRRRSFEFGDLPKATLDFMEANRT